MVPSYDAIQKCINYKGNRPNGVDASFIPLNDHWGFKYFRVKRRAIGHFLRQKWAHMHFLAPMLGEFCNFEYRGMEFWGFVTQILQVPTYDKNCRIRQRAAAFCERRLEDFWGVPADHKLVKELVNLGFHNNNNNNNYYVNFDLHLKNIGVDEILDIVLPIDFGWGEQMDFDLDNSDIAAILKRNNIAMEDFIRA